MTEVYGDIIMKFDLLTNEIQPQSSGLYYKDKDFNEAACLKLYDNTTYKNLFQYIKTKSTKRLKYIVTHNGLSI